VSARCPAGFMVSVASHVPNDAVPADLGRPRRAAPDEHEIRFFPSSALSRPSPRIGRRAGTIRPGMWSRSRRIPRRCRFLGLHGATAGSLAPLRVIRIATARWCRSDAQYGGAPALTWTYDKCNVIRSDLAGNGNSQGRCAIQWSRCRVAGGTRSVVPACRGGGERCVRGLARISSNWKVGGGTSGRPFRRLGAAPDLAHPAAKIGYPALCHNFAIGAVTYAADCLCNHSGHCSFDPVMGTFNLASKLTTIVWTVCKATWRALVGAVLIRQSAGMSQWILQRCGVQEDEGNMPKMLHRL
jgi:hypothetical protein